MSDDVITQLDETPVDGFGVPFPPEKQQQHWDYVKRGIEVFEERKTYEQLNAPPMPEPEWKETPAGCYNKGSRI